MLIFYIETAILMIKVIEIAENALFITDFTEKSLISLKIMVK